MASTNKTSSVHHQKGITRVAFSPDGGHCFTSGDEGYIRAVDEKSPTMESTLIDYHEEPVTFIGVSSQYICSASESGAVAVHKTENNEFVQILTRFSLPARAVAFDPRGAFVACVSDELTIKIIELDDPINVKVMAGHKRALRDVGWPQPNLVSTSSCDGDFMLWDVSKDSPECVKEFTALLPPIEPESETGPGSVWRPDGEVCAVALREIGHIGLVSSESYELLPGVFRTPDSHAAPITALAWSANGRYLASASRDGAIIVWNNATRLPVIRTKIEGATVVTSMAFHPAQNQLAYTDLEGRITRWNDVIPANLPGPTASTDAAPGTQAEDEFDRELGEDWIEDDSGVFAATTRAAPAPAPQFVPSHIPTVHPTFQPGATPPRDRRRYLAFNLLGYIHVVQRETSNIITVEFHDKSSHAGFHFTDAVLYDLAALGETGTAFARSAASGATNASIFYRPHESSDPADGWSYSLPEGEAVTALAVGGFPAGPTADMRDALTGTGTVVAATSAGFLRFFTGSGVQVHVANFGSVISLVAGRSTLLALHPRGGGVSYTTLSLETGAPLNSGDVPLIQGRTLVWAGFAAGEGGEALGDGNAPEIPAIADSVGLFSVLSGPAGPRSTAYTAPTWTPVLDTSTLARRKTRQESYWPVGLAAPRAALVLILKGLERYPGFPTPLLQELELRIPLLKPDSEQSTLEERFTRERLFAADRGSVTLDKYLLNLVRTACKADRIYAALDYARLLSQPSSVEAAIKIARFFKVDALDDKLALVQDAKRGLYAGGAADTETWTRDDEVRIPASSALFSQISRLSSTIGGDASNPFKSGAGGYGPRYGVHDDTRGLSEFRGFSETPDLAETYHKPAPNNSDSQFAHHDEITLDDTEAPRKRSAEDDTHVSKPSKKPGVNPFAKKAAPPPPPPGTSLFASVRSEAPGKKKQVAADLNRTGSFFKRVENKAVSNKSKGKQTTLFGFSSANDDVNQELHDTQDSVDSLADTQVETQVETLEDAQVELEEAQSESGEEEVVHEVVPEYKKPLAKPVVPAVTTASKLDRFKMAQAPIMADVE